MAQAGNYLRGVQEAGGPVFQVGGRGPPGSEVQPGQDLQISQFLLSHVTQQLPPHRQQPPPQQQQRLNSPRLTSSLSLFKFVTIKIF